MLAHRQKARRAGGRTDRRDGGKNSNPAERVRERRDNEKKSRGEEKREVRDKAEDKLTKERMVCCSILRRRAGDDLQEL